MAISHQGRSWVEVTPTVDTSAYADGDLLFDKVLIPGCGWSGAEPVNLQTVVLQDVDDEAGTNIELYFFNTSTTLGTINSAFNPSDTLMLACVGMLEVPGSEAVDYGGGKITCLHGLNMVMPTVAVTGSGASLYVAGVVRGAPTYTAATDLKLRLGFWT
jgi:hypothetical protein